MEDKVKQYTKGDCWHLAMKIAELTGWDLVETHPDDYEPAHVLTRTPDGQLLDIEGFHDPDEFENLISFDPYKEINGFSWRDQGYIFKDTKHEVDHDARTRAGSSAGQSSGLIIRRSQVRSLPGPLAR